MTEALERIHQEMRQEAQKMGRIRFLPTPPNQGMMWITHRSELARDLAKTLDAPVLTMTQLKRRSAMNALPLIGTILTDPLMSRHRSKRLWKKLRQRTAKPLYGKPMHVIVDFDRIKHLLKEPE